jgi:hypothetical protein
VGKRMEISHFFVRCVYHSPPPPTTKFENKNNQHLSQISINSNKYQISISHIGNGVSVKLRISLTLDVTFDKIIDTYKPNIESDSRNK